MINLTIDPVLQTREAVMAAAGRVQLALTGQDGLVRYVKIEAKRKSPSGGYQRGTVALDEATHVFVSEKGYGTQRVGTYYPPKPGYAEGRWFPADGMEGTAHDRAFQAAAAYINGQPLDPGFESIKAESQCGVCGRKLEDPISIERGIGPDCAAKPTGTRILHASCFAATVPTPLDAKRDEHTAAERRVAELEALLADARADESRLANELWAMHKDEFAKQEAEQERQAVMASIAATVGV